MAFGLDIVTSYGITANYWKIAKIEKSPVAESAYIQIYGYTSKEMKTNKHLESRFINIFPKDYQEVFGIDKMSQEGMNDSKSIYEFMKENFPEFKDAEFVDNTIVPLETTIK